MSLLHMRGCNQGSQLLGRTSSLRMADLRGFFTLLQELLLLALGDYLLVFRGLFSYFYGILHLNLGAYSLGFRYYSRLHLCTTQSRHVWKQPHVIASYEGHACWPLTKFWRSLVRFDLFWDFDRLSKVERKLKLISQDLGPLFRDFWVLGLCNWYGDVSPWVYPFLGLSCNV